MQVCAAIIGIRNYQVEESLLRKSRNPALPGWLSILLSVAFVLASFAVVVFSYLTMQIVWTRAVNPVEAAAEDVSSVELELNQDAPQPVLTLPPGEPTPTLIPTSEARSADERTNILVMGIDRRPGESFVSRTDSMLLVSIDPQTEGASMLSIPRDLYTVIPGYGRDRINTAFVYGSSGDNPIGGAAMAMNTVEYNLGVPVDHYILIDFGAVIKGIDTLGGVDVRVPFDIDDPTYPDMNYGFDPLYIPAGMQHMDGTTALKYARTRHVDNDFGRAYRQQQLIMAARDKALGLGIGGLLTRAPELYARVEQGVRTDLSLEQIVQLAQVASGIDSENISSAVLDQNYVSPFITDNGAQVLVLDPEATTPLINDLFYGE
jgi:LCP family protein required for cell wall assembly